MLILFLKATFLLILADKSVMSITTLCCQELEQQYECNIFFKHNCVNERMNEKEVMYPFLVINTSIMHFECIS